MIDFNDVEQAAAPPNFDLDEIRDRLRSQAAQIYPGLFREAVLSRDKRSLRCADLSGRAPRNEGSCVIHLAGPRAGTGHDFATNEHAGPIDLVEWATGLTGFAVFQECARLVGLDATRPAPKWRQYRQETKPGEQRDVSLDIARIKAECEPLAGTLGETYLAGRGLKDPASDDLLFHPDLTDFETRRGYFGIVATVRNGAGEPTGGIHRTFLTDDGTGKAAPGRKMLGLVAGGSVRLSPILDGSLGIAEGIETALAVMQIFAGVSCWAALSADNVARLDLPAGVNDVSIYRDAGEAGEKAAATLAGRLVAAGIRCRIVAPLHGDDFADDLLHGVKAADYQARNSEPGAPPPGKSAGRLVYDDFWTSLPDMKFIHVPDGNLWPAGAVNAQLPKKKIGDLEIPAAQWLARHRAVEQMSWVPGAPQIIRNRLVVEGGWIDRQGAAVFNLYRPPRVELGDPAKADRWLNHVHEIYPDDASHLIACFAHRVQRPGEKINHGVVLAGPPKIGKDTILEPLRYAVGAWNVVDISPRTIQGRFNGHVKSVVLVISEASDLGDVDRYAFYESSKTLMATPPPVMRVDEKHAREYAIPNVTWVVITTNHRTTALYLPADDRRHYVTWSSASPDAFSPAYWIELYRWYQREGLRHVAAYLAAYDLSDFDAKAAPPKTPAFWAIVDAQRAPEDAELADVLDKLGNPDAVTLERIASVASADFAGWLRDRKNRRTTPHRMEAVGYIPVRNSADARDGQWRVDGKRQTVYADATLSMRDQIAAAAALAGCA